MHGEMNPHMKKAYAKGLKELIGKMRSLEADEKMEEESEPSNPVHENPMQDMFEPMMDGYKDPGVMAKDGKPVADDGEEEDLESMKKAFFKRPASEPVKGKTRSVIMSMTMKSPDKSKIPPTKRHMF